MMEAISRRMFLGSTAGIGLGLALGAQAQAVDTSGARRIAYIDCTQDYGADRYFGQGNCLVVESPAGRYREAEPAPLSRFGYRFEIEHAGAPHVAVIRYPDNKRRFMCVMDGTCYDLTTGVLTGWEQPLSGAMLELNQVFWPRWNECSIVFMTWGEGEPAAAASIEILELDALSTLSIPNDPGDGSRRSIGIQYEDPCNFGASEGSINHTQWIGRVIDYARHTGQGLLTYPMAWYHGPLFPSERQPSGSLGVVVAPDRNQYLCWSTQPVDWYADLLQRFGEAGIGFQGALTLMRLGSLLETMNIDLLSIQGGADTYNNMMWNDQVQSSTNDWTPIYNPRNFNTIEKNLVGQEPIEPYRGLPEWAYGERNTPGSHMAPIFNPLHPIVQQAIVDFARELGERYGKFPAFKGISFNMFASCMPWFGSLHAGYDDTTIRMFQEETNIEVPVDAAAPDRFSKRYAYLTHVCYPAWVQWRCRKIRQLFGSIHEALASARSDLRVTVTLWDETVTPGVLGSITDALHLGARRSMLELYREAGIDPALYHDQPGLDVDLSLGSSRDRGGAGPNPSAGVNLPLAQSTMFRDFNYLDADCLGAVAGLPHPGVFVFNCWVEAWGRHVWFRPAPDDPNVAELRVFDGQPAEGILRMNSEYPADGFWWNSQARITPPFPSGLHFLEPYAHALAELDACRITRGGLFLDKAHGEYLRRFAPAYRALPNVKFETVGATTDPVAVRTIVADGRRYVYAVNRDYYEIDVEIAFRQPPQYLTDLATDMPMEPAGTLRITLEPYGLRTLAMPPEMEITNVAATPPADIAAAIREETTGALAAFDGIRAAGLFIPGMDNLERRMKSALDEGRLAFLRRAVTSYTVRKARELLA